MSRATLCIGGDPTEGGIRPCIGGDPTEGGGLFTLFVEGNSMIAVTCGHEMAAAMCRRRDLDAVCEASQTSLAANERSA
jgi:hypothetical protein